MPEPVMERLTDGSKRAPAPDGTDTLMVRAYPALRRMAEARLRGLPPGLTMQATAIVHEAWLDLRADGDRQWESDAHFAGTAARAVRDVVVDAARRRCRIKRGGGSGRVSLAADVVIAPELPADPESILRLDEALRQLERTAPDPATVVRLRWFAGLTHESIAAATGTSVRTVERRWRFARAWLAVQIAGDGAAA